MGMIMLEVRAEFIDLSFDAKMGKKSEIKQEENGNQDQDSHSKKGNP